MNPQRRLELSRALSKLDRLGPGEPLPSAEGTRKPGPALRIGITGPLGAGKSTLIDRITDWYRQADKTVGIVAVDPSSPFTGGAVLGDRVRMTGRTLDDGVFIRSLATRGISGGLTVTAIDAADIIDTFGYDRIIIETVGVGQSEVDIVEACDLTVVVFEPGAGDGVQALKAGLMEIADIFVVNKKDMKGADRFIMDLESVLEMKHEGERPVVMATSANSGEGIPEFCQWCEEWFKGKQADGSLTRRRLAQRSTRLRRAADQVLISKMWRELSDADIRTAAARDIPVRDAARELVEKFLS